MIHLRKTNANVPTDRPLQICDTIFVSTNFTISKYDLAVFESIKWYYFKMAIYLLQKLVLYLTFYLFDHIVRCVVGAYFEGNKLLSILSFVLLLKYTVFQRIYVCTVWVSALPIV